MGKHSTESENILACTSNITRAHFYHELLSVEQSILAISEKEKRKCSIMLSGFDCSSVNDVCESFKEVCQILNVGSVDLSDVVKISDKKLFRAKVLNDEKRRNLLMVTGRLRTIEGFENVYIQKDLAYR